MENGRKYLTFGAIERRRARVGRIRASVRLFCIGLARMRRAYWAKGREEGITGREGEYEQPLRDCLSVCRAMDYEVYGIIGLWDPGKGTRE